MHALPAVRPATRSPADRTKAQRAARVSMAWIVARRVRDENDLPAAASGGGHPAFDAATIDPVSVRFGPGGVESWTRGDWQDVDGDGDVDLVLHFETSRAGLGRSDTQACLSGRTREGPGCSKRPPRDQSRRV